MSNAQAFAALDGMVAKAALDGFVADAAPDCAIAVEDAFERQITAGTDAEGKAWQRTEEGAQPLKTAAKALVVVPVGTSIVCRLKGHIARHHRGIAKGGIVRAIFPERGLTPKLADAIKTALVAKFRERTGGE